MKTHSRMKAVFHGDVQGVGFRYTTRHIASSFSVTGTVRNDFDGTVELVAEGERGELEGFLETVSHRMARHIDRREVEWAPATGEFRSFRISLG